MTQSNPFKILLRANGERPVEHGRYLPTASQGIYPGMPLTLAAAGTLSKATTTTIWAGMVAVEHPYNTVTTANVASIEEVYADGESVAYVQLQKGDEFYAILADGETITIGDVLTVNAGQMTEITPDATTVYGTPLFVAMEAVTTSGATARIRVKVA